MKTWLLLSLLSLALAIVVVGLLCSPVVADETYKPYRRSDRTEELFRIAFDKNDVIISLTEQGKEHSVSFSRKSISQKDGLVSANGKVLFDQDGLILDGIRRSYEQVIDMRVVDDDDFVTISFLTREDSPRKIDRLKRGNRIGFSRDVMVEDDEFVRGIIFSVTGDVEVYGEVNKDIVSLFGDVYIGPSAVARGDIASVTGRIDVARDASVYGEIYSSKDRRVTRRHRFKRRAKMFTTEGEVNYNRVDGFFLGGGLRFDDPDSLLPSAWAGTGYAFASGRWRFDLGLEQTLWRERPLAVGATYYRKLVSEDDWLLDDEENSVFVVLAKEDFKDYYETEGAGLYVKFNPVPTLSFETRFLHEETEWLDAHRNLWSLFGGGKKLRENFSTVEGPFRDSGIVDIDSKVNAFVNARIDFDTRIPNEPFEQSAWHFTGILEWSSPDLESDFDYRRYTMSLRRYQKVHRRAMLLLRAMYGGSDNDLPMHKQFFLGGLGTLRGYDHKEFMDNQFWMANAEYRISFPRTDMAASLFWDVGQIDNGAKPESRNEVKHSVGVGLSLGDDLRVNLSKRLDSYDDDHPKIYVRLEHVF